MAAGLTAQTSNAVPFDPKNLHGVQLDEPSKKWKGKRSIGLTAMYNTARESVLKHMQVPLKENILEGAVVFME